MAFAAPHIIGTGTAPKAKETSAFKSYRQNNVATDTGAVLMYLDMNSFFATCEQQANPELRGKPIGVTTHNSPFSTVIAPSIEAKKFGVKTGMRLNECRELCPGIIPVQTHPPYYRRIHVDIMEILHRYCDDVLAKSIDEAVANFTSYRLVYKNFISVARQIKQDIAEKYDYLRCSIGIAPNTFLAKLGTELQKPDGLIQITPDNIDRYLAHLKLTDLPGIASRNERRLLMIGIKSPLEMRHASEALLRKAFGGVVGNYWHRRLNFAEVDQYSNGLNRTMSATRTVSREQRESKQALDSLLISLCTRLEQRMVKMDLFCKEASFFIRYRNNTGWDTKIKFAQPVQDAMELRSYILERIQEFEQGNSKPMFNNNTLSMGVGVQGFMLGSVMQYSLFDNRILKDKVRKVMYNIKDKYGKNTVRKGCELFDPHAMRDAIGFGSVKDMFMVHDDGETAVRNQYLLEDEDW
jgi:DNA polymerase-4